jgi:ribosome recycling factor
MVEEILGSVEDKMKKALGFFEEELGSIRGARAQVGLVDSIKVDAYGQEMVLKQVATVSTPDARTIMIQPWDKALMASIEKAIRDNQSLGLNPSNDGNVIRLNVPALTEERRAELAKSLNAKLEECSITLRGARHEGMDKAKKQKNNKEITEDDLFIVEQRLNKLIEKYQSLAQDNLAAKQKEIMEV